MCLMHVLSDSFFTFVTNLIITASWAISVYYAYQRIWKPFNPILGETYEMVNQGGITFLAEQVFISYVVFMGSLPLSIPPIYQIMLPLLCMPAFGRTAIFFSWILSFAWLGQHVVYGSFIYFFPMILSLCIGYLTDVYFNFRLVIIPQ